MRASVLFVGAVLVALSVFSRPASAAVIVFNTSPGGQSGGQPIAAKATITTGLDEVKIVLENLRADPKSVAQCLSGIQFGLSGGQTNATLKSSSAVERTLGANDTYSDGATVSTGWQLSKVGSELRLTLLGTQTAPQHLIIGPPNASNLYPAANPSITNAPHNPLLAEKATFILDVPGVTPLSSINAATFVFNTSSGNNAPGVPEPGASALLLGAAVGVIRRRRA